MTMSESVRRFCTLLSLATAFGCSHNEETWRARLADPDRNVRRAAVRDVASTVESATAVPILTDALRDTDDRVKVAAALAILRIEPNNEDCRRVVERALEGGQGPVFVALGVTGEEARWAIPTLVALLKDRKTAVRALAAKTLGEIGDASAEVVQALQKRNTDESPSVRSAVQKSLARLGQLPNEAP